MSFGKKDDRSDRRQFGRRETSHSARIRIPGKPSQACVVRNLSDGGALLECDYPRMLPFRFELDIPALGARHQCEARHCTDTTLGVEFTRLEAGIDPPSEASHPEPRRSGWGTETRQVRDARAVIDRLKSGRQTPDRA